MSLKRKFVYGVFLFLLLLVCTLALLFFFAPPYLNSELFSQIVRDAGLKGFSWDVRRIGLTGADIGSLQIGTDEKKALSVKSVQLDYSVKGLYKKHIKSVLVSGVDFYCGFKDGRFAIRGFDLQTFLDRFESEKNAPSPSKDADLPFSVGNLEIRSAMIVLEWEGKRLRIPFECKLTPKNSRFFHGILHAFPRTQEITTIFDLDLYAKRIHLKLDARAIHLERFSDLTGRIPGLGVSGELNMTGKAELIFKPFQISSVWASCEFLSKNSVYNRFKLKNFRDSAIKNPPFRCEIRSIDGKKWDITASSAALISPVPLRISRINALFRHSRENLECSGDFLFELEKSDGEQTDSFKIVKPMVSKGNFFAKWIKNGGWDFKLTSQAPDANLSKTGSFQINEIGIEAKVPKIDIFARKKSDGVTATIDVKIPKVHVTAGRTGVQIPALSFNGAARFSEIGAKEATVEFSAPNTNVKMDTTTVKLPEIFLSGKMRQLKDRALHFDGALNILNGDIADSKLKARIKGINTTFPFQWAWKTSKRKGKVSVASIRWDKFNMGSLNGFVRQNKLGVTFGGKHLSKLIPGFNLNLKGESLFFSRKNRTEVKFDSRYNAVSPMGLEKFYPGAKGVEVKGALKLNGELISDTTGLRCKIDTILDNANVWVKERAVAVENIRLKLSVPDVLKLRSAPRQELFVENISFGNIHLRDANIEFQIESDRSLLIEKGNFRWCDGNLSSQALRITPGVQDYDLILYCDRLNLSKLLMQLGVAQAKGKGAVSGRVHVRFKDGVLSFYDGFLFSTPGEGGTIHVAGAEMLTTGIAKNTPQYAQIELAREALKDYKYKWVRLRLMTEGEKLMLQMKFDGKPANPLPFVYKEEFGGFVRDESGKRFSNFQGIRLNVNLGLPLNEILRYKGILNTITNN